MKKFLLSFGLILLVLGAISQNSSTSIRMVSFNKLPNEIVDMRTLKEEAGRDSDFEGNKAALIRVKAQGFNERTMQDFTVFARSGVEIIHKKYQDGEMWLYVSSNCQGTIVIKYMGEYEWKLPQKLEAKSVYELVLGMETATLIIVAMPNNADIYIDGEKVGSGYASKSVSIGTEHHWKVECADFVTKEGVKLFQDRGEELIDVELAPNFGYITVTSDPSEAEIYIDGQSVGTTPYSMKKISIGSHTVELRQYGYLTLKNTVIVDPGAHNRQLENVALERDSNITERQIANYVSGKTYTDAFSVSETTTVYFAKGNLQYQASTKTWRFAEHQWDAIGEANKNVSKKYSGWIDHFGWGTGKKPTNTSKKSADYKSFKDWGNNTISNGGGKTWRTLNKDEWEYVFKKRHTNNDIRYAKAIVNNVKGIILLPDDWDNSYYSLNNTNSSWVAFSSNNISKSDWINKLEANGAIFLPITGGRYGTDVLNTDVSGFYWSSVGYETEYAYYLVFTEDKVWPTDSGGRAGAMSVRLVCSAE